MLLLREDAVDVLPFSARAVQYLKTHNIYTIERLLRFNYSDVPDSLYNEIQNIVIDLNISVGYQILPLESFPKISMFELHDVPIWKMPVSYRVKHSLTMHGINTMVDLIGENTSSLSKRAGISKYYAETVLSHHREWLNSLKAVGHSQTLDNEENYPLWIWTASKQMSEFCQMSQNDAMKMITCPGDPVPEIPNAEFLDAFLFNSATMITMKRSVLWYLNGHPYGAEKEDLIAAMPTFLGRVYVDIILKEMLEFKQIVSWDTMIQKKVPLYKEFEQSIKDPMRQNVFYMLTSGLTLEQIGEIYGVSRQRIDQIKTVVLNERPPILEDRYLPLMENYDVSLQDFMGAFNEPSSTWHYLLLVRGRNKKRHKQPLKEALHDPRLLPSIQKRVYRIVYKDHVLIDGRLVRKSRPELARAAVEKYCQSRITFDQFLVHYNDMLKDLGLDHNRKLLITFRSYQNKFETCNYVLWTRNRRMRFYDLEKADVESFYDQIELDQFRDVEISCRLIYQKNPQLMKQFNIIDEYELHNFLKKTMPQELQDHLNLTIARMPTLRFGNGSTQNQMQALLEELAPVSSSDLTREFEERYGFSKETILANYIVPFQKYYHGGVYRIDYADIPEENRTAFLNNLPYELYYISDLKTRYAEMFPNEDPEQINPMTLRDMGMLVYSRQALYGPWYTTKEYFQSLISKMDIVNLSELRSRYGGMQALTTFLVEARQSREIIEFARGRAYSGAYLTRIGITSDLMDSFCQLVHKVVPDDKPVTVQWIRKKGIQHRLMSYGDCFLASILTSGPNPFQFTFIRRDRILWRGDGNYSGEDMVLGFLREHGPMKKRDLVDALTEEYGGGWWNFYLTTRPVLMALYDRETDVCDIKRTAAKAQES